MLKSFKRQVIAVSETGGTMLINKPLFGEHEEDIVAAIEEEIAILPAGIYVVDFLVSIGAKVEAIDIDVCYCLAEYRDYDLYSGEEKLT